MGPWKTATLGLNLKTTTLGLSRGLQIKYHYIAFYFGALKLPLLLQHTVACAWGYDFFKILFYHSSKSYNIAGNQVGIAKLCKCPVI